MVYRSGCTVWMFDESFFKQSLHVCWVEDVPIRFVAFQELPYWVNDGDEADQECQTPGDSHGGDWRCVCVGERVDPIVDGIVDGIDCKVLSVYWLNDFVKQRGIFISKTGTRIAESCDLT